MLFDYMIQLGPSLDVEATSSGLKFEHCLIRAFFTHIMDGTMSPEIDATAVGTALYWPLRSRPAADEVGQGCIRLRGLYNRKRRSRPVAPFPFVRRIPDVGNRHDCHHAFSI